MILILEMPLPEKRAQNVLIDEIVEFELPEAKEKYPKKLRRIAVWNDEHEHTFQLFNIDKHFPPMVESSDASLSTYY